MSEQLSLLRLDAVARAFWPDAIPNPRGRLQGYTLLTAILPESGDALRFAPIATRLGNHHELGGAPLLPERLHISQQKIASYGCSDTIPQAVVDAVITASAGVVCPPLPIVFDQALSFPESNAFVLRCNSASDMAVARLRESLALALRRTGLRPEPARTPHMTMLYDPRHIAQHPIEPIRWTATRFALILSHVGIGHHQLIAEWALASQPSSAFGLGTSEAAGITGRAARGPAGGSGHPDKRS